MKKFAFETYTIEIFNDDDYNSGSADNVNRYAKEYHSDIGYYRPSSRHGIRIYNDETETNSCILLGYGGGTAIHENSALLDGDRLVVCCGDAVFCLALPELNLLWTTRADDVTAFQIFRVC